MEGGGGSTEGHDDMVDDVQSTPTTTTTAPGTISPGTTSPDQRMKDAMMRQHGFTFQNNRKQNFAITLITPEEAKNITDAYKNMMGPRETYTPGTTPWVVEISYNTQNKKVNVGLTAHDMIINKGVQEAIASVIGEGAQFNIPSESMLLQPRCLPIHALPQSVL